MHITHRSTSDLIAEVIDLTRQLIRFNTTNPPGNEEPALRHLGAYLEAHGVQVQYQQLDEPNRVNLIARVSGAAPTGHLVFSGHMDVVPAGPGWSVDPFAADLVDGRIVGRGAADMKGGVASMAVALAHLARDGFSPRADLILVVSSGEERGGAGAQLMAASGVLAGSAYLVVGEPTGLELCPAQKGIQLWNITAHGTACHSSTPHLGVSAISYMARVIPALEANPFPYTRHPLLGEATINVTMIKGGAAPNIIPDTCTVTVMMRLVPGQDRDNNTAILKRLLLDIASDAGMNIRIEITGRSGPATETPVEHPFLSIVLEAVTDARGSQPDLLPFTGGTEAAILAPAYDLPMVIFGPGKLAQAHEVDEYVEIDELDTATHSYMRIAERLLT